MKKIVKVGLVLAALAATAAGVVAWRTLRNE